MIESPLPYVSHKTAPFRAPALCGNRSSGVQPISVNRQPCSCLMQWSDRELPAFGMSHRTAPPEPLFYVGTGAQPLSVKIRSRLFLRDVYLASLVVLTLTPLLPPGERIVIHIRG